MCVGGGGGGAGKRKETTVPDDNLYDTLLAMLKGKFSVPKKDWSRVEYVAKQRIYRYINKHVAQKASRCGPRPRKQKTSSQKRSR